MILAFFFEAEDGIRYKLVTGVQTCALPIFPRAGIADEKDLGVRVLDLVRRDWRGCGDGPPCPRFGDMLRQIPHPNAALVIAGECAALIGAPSYTLHATLVAHECAHAASRLHIPQPHGPTTT